MSTRTLRSNRLPSPFRIAKSQGKSKANSTTTSNLSTRRSAASKTTTSTSTPTSTSRTKYWLIVASRDHVLSALHDGICQANHGKLAPLKRMKQGDGVLFYSAKESYTAPAPGKAKRANGEVCQKFTAIGRVRDERIYQVDVNGNGTWMPYRRDVEYVEGAREVGIRGLIEKLAFVGDKERWGASLRYGFLEVGKGDFELVEKEMIGEGRDLDDE